MSESGLFNKYAHQNNVISFFPHPAVLPQPSLMANCCLTAGVTNGAAVIEHGVAIPQKLNRRLPQEPAVVLLGIHTNELK
jgi:hypothetical protein